MKYSTLFLLPAIILFISCNENQPDKTAGSKDTSKAVENKIMIPASSCFLSATGKDTVILKVEVFAHVVTGALSYKLHEKDSNKGEFDGQLHGDTLLADYTFMSEGVRSVRQIAFLIKDNAAIEGHGNMKEEGGKMVFTDAKNLDFGKGLTLKRVPCDY